MVNETYLKELSDKVLEAETQRNYFESEAGLKFLEFLKVIREDAFNKFYNNIGDPSAHRQVLHNYDAIISYFNSVEKSGLSATKKLVEYQKVN